MRTSACRARQVVAGDFFDFVRIGLQLSYFLLGCCSPCSADPIGGYFFDFTLRAGAWPETGARRKVVHDEDGQAEPITRVHNV